MLNPRSPWGIYRWKECSMLDCLVTEVVVHFSSGVDGRCSKPDEKSGIRHLIFNERVMAQHNLPIPIWLDSVVSRRKRKSNPRKGRRCRKRWQEKEGRRRRKKRREEKKRKRKNKKKGGEREEKEVNIRYWRKKKKNRIKIKTEEEKEKKRK